MTKKKIGPRSTKTTTKTTAVSAPEQTVEAPPALSAAAKLDTAIREKARSLQQNAIADLWAYVEKPNKDEFDLDVLELLAAREILNPPSRLEGALAGQLLNGLVIRSKVRPKPASISDFGTFGPFLTGNPPQP